MREPSLQDLPRLIRSGTDDAGTNRAVLLRVQTDLFVSAISRAPTARRAYETFALATLPLVDAETRFKVARTLAPCREAPARVVAMLLTAEPDAARITIGTLAALDPARMDTIAETGAAHLAEGLAMRRDLAAHHVEGLIDHDRSTIDLTLAANPDASLHRDAVDRLIARTPAQPALAAALLARTDLTAIQKAPLYLFAGPGPRETILTALVGPSLLRPAPPTLTSMEVADVVTAARRQDWGDVHDRLAAAARLDLRAAGRIAADPDGLALLLTALGVSPEDAAAVFLSLEAEVSHSVERVFGLVERVRTTSRSLAGLAVAAIAGESSDKGRHGTRHVPAFAADEAKRPATRKPARPILPAADRDRFGGR